MKYPYIVRLSAVAVVVGGAALHADQITSEGAVTALTNINQMGTITGTANFDAGPVNTPVPLTEYAAQGLTFYSGSFSSILAGVTTPGTAQQPYYASAGASFPSPSDGGSASGLQNYYAGVATFSQPTTEFGLTAGNNGEQYIDVWNTAGQLIGQVDWIPDGSSSFVGISTNGVQIGMVSYGNDDLWNGGTYDVGGATIMSDNWVWSSAAAPAASAPDGGSSIMMLGIALLGILGFHRQQRAKVC